jgi:hypothetical protein
MYGSADPDPHQNVTDPQHWFVPILTVLTENQGILNISLFGNEKVGNAEKSVSGKQKLRNRTTKQLRIQKTWKLRILTARKLRIRTAKMLRIRTYKKLSDFGESRTLDREGWATYLGLTVLLPVYHWPGLQFGVHPAISSTYRSPSGRIPLLYCELRRKYRLYHRPVQIKYGINVRYM